MYNKHLYCLTMSTTLKIVDMRLDKDEVSFLEKNKIKHEQKKRSHRKSFFCWLLCS